MSKVQQTAPMLRFKGYTDAWVQRKLNSVFSKIRNAFVGTATPYYVDKQEGHFYLQSNNVKDGHINRDSEIFINQEFYEKQKDKWLHTGDLVMVQSGHVGHTAVIPEELNNSAAHALIMFNNINADADSYFLNYGFQTPQTKKRLDVITTGNTIKHILASEMSEFTVEAPSFSEQSAIGNFFRTLDNTITLHKRKLDRLKELKNGYLQQMFPQNGESVPRLRFNGFNRSWERRKLVEVIKVNSGRDYKHLNDGDVPVYGTGGYMLSVDESLSEDNAIGIGRKGTIDKPQLLSAPFWTVDTLFFLTPINNNDLLFLFSLSQTIDWTKMDESTGVPSLSKVNIEKIDVCVPCADEQTAIGNFFCILDRQIGAQAKKIEQIIKLKSAYLQKMFI